MKGLKLEPGCRHAWVTWLNLFLLKSKPPTSARIAPSCGVIEISAPSSCQLGDRPRALRVFPHPDDSARPDADCVRRARQERVGDRTQALVANAQRLTAQ